MSKFKELKKLLNIDVVLFYILQYNMSNTLSFRKTLWEVSLQNQIPLYRFVKKIYVFVRNDDSSFYFVIKFVTLLFYLNKNANNFSDAI